MRIVTLMLRLGARGSRGSTPQHTELEASQGGMKVGRIEGLVYEDSYLGIIHPTPGALRLRPQKST